MYITKKKLTDYYKIDYRKYWIDSGMDISVEDLLKNSYVISMNDDKLNLMKTVFEKHGLAPFPKKWPAASFMHVTSGCAIEKHVNAANPNLLKAIGCSAAHLSIVVAAKEMNLPYVCIFEDDAYPCLNINAKLQCYLDGIPADTKCMILGNYRFKYSKVLDGKYFSTTLSSPNGFWGAHAYIVFKSGYDEFIQISNEQNFIADHRLVLISNSISPKENLFIQYNIDPNSISGQSTGTNYLWRNRTPEQIFKEFPRIEEILKDNLNDNHN